MDDIDFKFIKKWMAYGEITKLAKKHSISGNAATMILKGRAKNFEFLLECYELAIARAAKFYHANNRLKQLTENL